MNEGITEIRPATTDEQLRAWLDRHIQLHKELNDPLYFEDVVAEECAADFNQIHVYDVKVVRRLAKAVNAAWTVRGLRCPDIEYQYWLGFKYKGFDVFGVCNKDDLTPEELKWLEEQEA